MSVVGCQSYNVVKTTRPSGAKVELSVQDASVPPTGVKTIRIYRTRPPGGSVPAKWLLRWIWPSLVRYPCPGGLHCHVRHATWPLETALQLEAGWGPYLSSTEGLEALPGLPRETG